MDAAEVGEWLTREGQALLSEHRIPGMAVGVCDRSGKTWAGAFGTTRRNGGRPITTKTLFSLQSCSKTYTATAVMLAVQEGLLDLDRPIVAYLPEFTVNSVFERSPERKLTLRHLLSHTAGFTHEAPVGNNFVVGRSSFDAHCRSISDTWLRFAVGDHCEYSNLGVDLAGHILARVSRLPFSDFVHSRLLAPLGLDRTTFDYRKIAADADRAAGHDSEASRLPVRVPMLAAGGLYASVEDVCRFVRLLAHGESQLAPELVDEMYGIPFAPPEQQFGYGLGVFHADWPTSGAVVGHSGGGFGFLSDMYWSAEAGVGVVVLTNASSHPLLGVLGDQVLSRLFDAQIRPEASAPLSRPLAPRETRPVEGEYIGRSGRLTIRLDDAGLLFIAGERSGALVLTGDADLALAEPPHTRWRLTFGESGRALLRRLIDGAVWYRNEGDNAAQQSFSSANYYLRSIGGLRRSVVLGSGVDGPYIKVQHEAPLRLREHKPGLFFTSTGEAVDLGRSPTYRNLPLHRTAGKP